MVLIGDFEDQNYSIIFAITAIFVQFFPFTFHSRIGVKIHLFPARKAKQICEVFHIFWKISTDLVKFFQSVRDFSTLNLMFF